jgi:hypothetical protein
MLETIGRYFRQSVAPWIQTLLESAARGEFPFGLGRQANLRPVAIRHCIEPIHAGRRMIGAAELVMMLARRRLTEGVKLGIGHLVLAEPEWR